MHRRPISVATRVLIAVPLLAAVDAGRSMAAMGRATAAQTLVQKAERNTNSVKSLVHRDIWNTKTAALTISVVARGAEDEVRNREQDAESVTVVGKDAQGNRRTLRYAVKIVFMNGKTYYKITPPGGAWKVRSGMTFSDPYAGTWRRGRTMVSYPSTLPFTVVGTAGGKTHVRAPLKGKNYVGSVDLWISTGATPYIVRKVESLRSTKGRAISQRTSIDFGPYNSTLVIEPPTQGGST